MRRIFCTLGLALATGLLLAPGLTPAQAPGLPHTFSSGTPALASEVNENFRDVAPTHVINVDTAAQLLEAVDPTNAVYAAHGAPSASNPYLIKVAPGVYDLGAQSLQMLSYVDVEGSGEGVTVVQAATDGALAGVLKGADNAEVRFLTVRHAGGVSNARGISMESVAFTVTHVTVDVDNAGTALGIVVQGGAPVIRHSTVDARSTGVQGVGIAIDAATVSHIHDTDVVVDDASGQTEGITVFNGEARMTNVRVDVANSHSSPSWVAGVRVGTNGNVEFRDGRIDLSAANIDGAALLTHASSAMLSVHHSVIIAGDGALGAGDYYLLNSGNGTVHLSTSQLGGNYNPGTGTVKCAYDYDTNLDGYGLTCPDLLI